MTAIDGVKKAKESSEKVSVEQFSQPNVAQSDSDIAHGMSQGGSPQDDSFHDTSYREMKSASQESEIASESSSPHVDEQFSSSSREPSLAELQKSRSKPWQSALYILAVVAALIIPFWIGRHLAIQHTKKVLQYFDHLTSHGAIFLGWVTTIVLITAIAVSVIESSHWRWRSILVLSLVAEQFIAGLSMLNVNFWYSTYVIFGNHSQIANAIDLGIVTAGIGVVVFIVIFFALLVLIRKDSPFNVLTRSWSSFIIFYLLEVIGLLIVMFSGIFVL